MVVKPRAIQPPRPRRLMTAECFLISRKSPPLISRAKKFPRFVSPDPPSHRRHPALDRVIQYCRASIIVRALGYWATRCTGRRFAPTRWRMVTVYSGVAWWASSLGTSAKRCVSKDGCNAQTRSHPSRRRAKSAAPQDEVGDRFSRRQDEASICGAMSGAANAGLILRSIAQRCVSKDGCYAQTGIRPK
jgi:hypothetical protein